MPVITAHEHQLVVVRTRPPAEVARLAANASRANDLTRLLALRARRARAGQ